LHFFRAHIWTFVGYSSWLFLPAIAFFALSFYPEKNNLSLFLETVITITDLFLTFLVGITLLLVIHKLVHKTSYTQETLKKETIRFISPSAVVLLLQFLAIVSGTILLIIPGIIAAVWFAFAQFMVLFEKKNGVEAMKESRKLIDGRFFSVFFRLIYGPVVIQILFAFFISLIISAVFLYTGETIDLEIVENIPSWIPLLQSAAEILILPMLATYMMMLYKQLKESLS